MKFFCPNKIKKDRSPNVDFFFLALFHSLPPNFVFCFFGISNESFCSFFRILARRSAESHEKCCMPRKSSKFSRKSEKPGSYAWRVFCASIPFQFLLIAAVFLAWTYQPKCCEATNGFVLMPQLRYFNGPPPI